MIKSSKRILLVAVIPIAILFMSFIYFIDNSPSSLKEEKEGASLTSSLQLKPIPKNLDSVPSNSETYYLADSINIYKARDNRWVRKKLNFENEQLVVNDSVDIRNLEAKLINIKNVAPYFENESFVFTKIKFIDSSINESIHEFFEKHEQSWKLQRQTIYDFNDPINYKTDILFKYYDTHTTELKNIYSKSINNAIFKFNKREYFNGEIFYDTLCYSKFDQAGNIKYQVRQGRDQNNEMIVFSKVNYHYNSLGLKSKMISFNSEGGKLKEVGSSIFEYDSNENLIQKIVFYDDNNYLNYTVKYKYDNLGNCIEQYYERNDEGYSFVLKQFTYNKKNQLIAYRHQNKMVESDAYKIVENITFEYNNKTGSLSKITKGDKVHLQLKFDEFGNVIEGFNLFGNYSTKIFQSFDYSIPYDNVVLKHDIRENKNFHQNVKVDEYGLTYYNVKNNYSHALSSKRIFRINDEQKKLSKIFQYTYSEVSL